MLQKLKTGLAVIASLTVIGWVTLPSAALAAPVTGDPNVNQPYTAPTTSSPSVDPAVSSNNCKQVSKCDLITKYINPLINFLAALVGVAVVISIVVGGVQYASSAGDPQKVAAAKGRITNAIIALITFIFLYALLNFLIPGGLV